MITLITGASHTGKSLLAQRLLEKHGWPHLSVDLLKMGLIRSGNTDLTPEDDDALVGYLWPIVCEMMKTAIENRQDLIVEGCYVPPTWREDFDKGYLQSIRFICLAMTDAFIDSNFSVIAQHACDIEQRLDDSSCTPESLKADNHRYIDTFTRSGEQVTLIDSDYEATIRFLVEQ